VAVRGQVGWAVVELRSGTGSGMQWQWIGGDVWWAMVLRRCGGVGWAVVGVEVQRGRRHAWTAVLRQVIGSDA
jgi:hypothetical protein